MKALIAMAALVLGAFGAYSLLGPQAQGVGSGVVLTEAGPGLGVLGQEASLGSGDETNTRADVDAGTGDDAEKTTMKTEVAMFAMGCFWKPELIFSKLEGVIDAEVGYAGGHVKNPSYRLVCTDTTGHAEVVRVTFDPEKVTYEQLLEKFWANHDPTQVNRQGPDHGTQYRTAIFALTPEQAAAARASKDALAKSGKYTRPIATQIVEDDPNYAKAEDYHQDYLAKRGMESCGI